MHRKLEDVIGKRGVVSAAATQSAMDAAKLMATYNVGSVLILNGTRLEGILTERDIISRVVAAGRSSEETRISEVMTRNPVVMSSEKPFINALLEMAQRGFRHIPVVDRFGVLGVVSMRDAVGTEQEAMERMIRSFESISAR